MYVCIYICSRQKKITLNSSVGSAAIYYTYLVLFFFFRRKYYGLKLMWIMERMISFCMCSKEWHFGLLFFQTKSKRVQPLIKITLNSSVGSAAIYYTYLVLFFFFRRKYYGLKFMWIMERMISFCMCSNKWSCLAFSPSIFPNKT